MTICTPWRVAASLNKLLDQINQAAPGRSTASDGSIGDASHQAQACSSQHNSCCVLYQGVWIVRARDFTHDPAHGADMAVIAENLRLSRDRRIRYVIFNRRSFSPNSNWQWVPYSGDNTHEHHMHVSTWDDAGRFDDVTTWQIGVQDMNEDQNLALQQILAIVRAGRWRWDTDRAGFLKAGGSAAVWDYGGGMGENKDSRFAGGNALFAREDETGDLYKVEAGMSSVLTVDTMDDVAYVLKQRGVQLMGPADPAKPGTEWVQVTSGSAKFWVRTGWSSAVFGPPIDEGLEKIGAGLTMISQKLDGIAAGGGLTDADRALMNELLDAVTDLNSRLATP